MIKNIIFDLGNVVLKLKWNIVIDRYTKDDETKKLLTEVIFESEEWKLLDLGTIEKDYALGVMLSKLPVYLHEACKGIMNEWRDALIINDKMISFLKKVRENGYKTYILSNAPHEIPPFLENNDLTQYFDGQIISAEEKVSKPDQGIYNLLLDRYDLNPEESVFLDDKLENIEAAKEANINGIVYDYNNHEKMLEELDKFDVNYR